VNPLAELKQWVLDEIAAAELRIKIAVLDDAVKAISVQRAAYQAQMDALKK
jgi:hypothetical protein